MASAQHPATVSRQTGFRTRLSRLSPMLADAFSTTAIVVLAILWIAIWTVLAYTTVQVEGLLNGLIMGAYAVVPVIAMAYFSIRRRMA